MSTTSPARIYALVVGVVLVAAGVIGFFYESAFTSDESVREAVLGILDVNGWHNVVHIASGVVGLMVAGSYDGSRLYAFGLGAVYLLVALLGFLAGNGDEIFNLIPINTEDNFLHLLSGLAGVAAGLVPPSAPAPSTA